MVEFGGQICLQTRPRLLVEFGLEVVKDTKIEEYITVLKNEQGNTIIKVGGVSIKMIENFNNIRRIIAKHHD